MKQQTKTKRLDGKSKQVRFTKRLAADLSAYCRDKGIESESELVRQAVAKYIYADYTDETLKLQGLNKNRKLLEELRDMINVLFSYMRLMHINLLAYHPEIDAQFADAAFNSANSRHEKVVKALQNNLDPQMFEQLLHNLFTKLNGDEDGQN